MQGPKEPMVREGKAPGVLGSGKGRWGLALHAEDEIVGANPLGESLEVVKVLVFDAALGHLASSRISHPGGVEEKDSAPSEEPPALVGEGDEEEAAHDAKAGAVKRSCEKTSLGVIRHTARVSRQWLI